MIFRLMRLDPSLKGLAGAGIFGLAGGLFLKGLTLRLPADLYSLEGDAKGWLLFTVAVAWFSCLMIILFNNLVFVSRTSEFFMALPITARDLWWARVVPILLGTTLPVLIATLVVAVQLSEGLTPPFLEVFYVKLGLRVLAVLVLCAFLFQVPWPELVKVPFRMGYLAFVILVSFGGLILVLLNPWVLSLTLGLLAASPFLAIHIHRKLPRAFLSHPTELETVEGEPIPIQRPLELEDGQSPVQPIQGSHAWVLVKMVYLTLSHSWKLWVLAPILGLFGFLLWDGFVEARNPFPNVLFLSVWPFFIAYQSMIRVYRLDHLPLNRRLLYAGIVVPSLFSVLIGFTAGGVSYMAIPRSGEPVRCAVCGVHLPPEFWEISWDGVIPEVEAPWGEVNQPSKLRVVPGLPTAVYMPYEVGDQSSPRYAAWQINRVLTLVTDRTHLTEAELASLPEDDPRMQQVLDLGHAPLQPSAFRGRVWLTGAIVCLSIVSLLFWTWLLQYRPGLTGRVSKILFLSLMAIWGGVLLWQLAGPIFGVHDPPGVGIVLFTAFRALAEYCDFGLLTLWLILIGLIGVLYLVGQRLFWGVEAPLGKIRTVWREFGRS